MVPSEIVIILQWWFFLFCIGILFLPLTFKFFPQFTDMGYALAKILGTAVISYIVFLLGILYLLPFTRLTVFAVMLLPLFAFFLYGVMRRRQWEMYVNMLADTIKKTWKIFLFEEIVFLAGIVSLSYIRGFSPDIHGLEKFMDFGFINSMLRAEYFPPKDMWLTPFSINYYYFGHLVAAILTKLTDIPPAISYNLMLATVFAFCLTASFSIGMTLASFIFSKTQKLFTLRRIFSGFLTAALVTLSGNLHSIYTFFKPYENEQPLPPWELAFSPFTFPNSYWYPNATRFIYNTIHEFPIYSWVVADLHAHVSDIPFVLFTIALLLSLFLRIHNPEPETDHTKHNKRLSLFGFSLPNFFGKMENGKFILLIGFLLAVMYMTNAWDGLIYFLLAALIIFAATFMREAKSNIVADLFRTGLKVLPSIILLGVGLVAFSLPFSLNFKPFASGIGILCAPEFLTNIGSFGPFLFETDHCQKSPLWQLLILYGFFYFFITVFFVFLSRIKKTLPSDYFVLFLMTLGTLLIVIPEFIYLKDIYPAHYRANTMFKLVFQAFIILSIASGYVIIRMIGRWQEQKNKLLNIYTPLLLFTFFLLTLVFIYPRMAIYSYYNNLKKYEGIDGTRYLEKLRPDDYVAINWLNETIPGQPVILEAQGDSYTDYARISSNTGLPTVLGWTVHEWLWRGKYDGGKDAPAPRIAEVQKMYESGNVEETRQLLKKYNVEYVYIGDLEREKYPSLTETKFDLLGERIFEENTTKIYRLNL